MGKRAKRKKAISRPEFEYRIRMTSVLIPLVVAVVTAATTLGTAYISRPATPKPEIHYSLSVEDRKELDRLRSEFKQAERELPTASTPEVKDALDRRLRRVALDEAEIMRKYDPEFEPRYPPPAIPAGNFMISSFDFRHALALLAFVGSYFLARLVVRPLARWVLRRHYQIQSEASSQSILLA